jgi:alkylation response protein AidB-like acyl-CoA dehydrogenase
MEFDGDQKARNFRSVVRTFLQTHWENGAQNARLRFLSPEAFRTGVKILNKGGWLAPNWPKRWGGAELSPVEQYVLDEELVAARFPPVDRIAFDLAAPVIYTFGSIEQKARYLPKILSGEEFWCQGFSEPEAGSDVNSLRTSATRDGNYYVVDGRKIWTTNAHFADMMFALVKIKSGAKLQNGLTFILIDMHDPDVSVRPLVTIDGGHHLNEVTLNKVRVPAANVVGEIGRGWTNARFLLANERVLVSQAPRTRQALACVKRWASLRQLDGRPLVTEPGFRQRLVQAEIELFAVEFAALRVLYASENDGTEGLASALKLRGSELRQRVSELAVEVLGDRGFIFYGRGEGPASTDELPEFSDYASGVLFEYLFNLSATIAGGTSEIQRNLMAGLALGL